MKKINIVLSVFLALLITITTFVTFRQNYERKIILRQQALTNDSSESPNYYLSFDFNENSSVSSKEIVNALIHFSETHHVDIIIQYETMHTQGLPTYIQSLYGNNLLPSFLQNIHLEKEISSIDFTDLNSDVVLINDPTGFEIYPKAIKIDRLHGTSDDIFVQKTWKNIEEELNNNTSEMGIYILSNEGTSVPQKLLIDISTDLGGILDVPTINKDNVAEILPMYKVQASSELNESHKTLLTLTVIVIMTLLLNMIQIFLNKRNEVTIRQLHGNSRITIFRKVMLREILSPYLVFLFVSVFTMTVLCYPFRSLTKELFSIGVEYWIIYTLLNVALIIGVFIITLLKSNVIHLKKKHTLQQVIQINTLFKIILLIVCILPLTLILNDYQNDVLQIYYMKALEEKFENGITVDYISTDLKDLDKSNEKIRNLNNVLSEKGFEYVNHINNSIEIENETIYIIEVNEVYFDRMNFSDYDLDNNSKQDVLLLSKNMEIYTDEIIQQTNCKECDVRLYTQTYIETMDSFADTSVFIPIHEMQMNYYGNTITNPVIKILKRQFINGGSSFSGSYYRTLDSDFNMEDFSEIQNEFASDLRVSASRTNTILHSRLVDATWNATYKITFLGFVFFTMTVLIIQNTFSYCEVNKKKLSIKLLHGYSFIRRFYMYYGINIIAYILVFLYIYFSYHELNLVLYPEMHYIVLALFTMELILMGIVLTFASKRKVMEIIKGDD